MKALGIGCFWFAARLEAYEKIDISATAGGHLQRIKEALESIDNVSGVTVRGSGDYLGGTQFLRDDEDQNYFPLYADVTIEFSIHIPFRIQEQLGKGWGACDVETFHATIVYDWDMPVIYISYDLPDNVDILTKSPSHAVMFIREYLKEKLKSNRYCDFQSLGPSPLHADIFILEDDIQAPNSELRPIERGYDVIVVRVPQKSNLIKIFIEQYQGILGPYYSIIGFRSVSIRNEIEILNDTQKLFKDGPYFIKAFKDRKLVNSIYKLILEDKYSTLNRNKFIADKLRDEAIHPENVFYPFIKKEMDENSNVPFEEVREILGMYEGRRQGFFENTAVLFSGLVGGVIGALFGAYLTYTLTQDVQDTKLLPSVVESKALKALNTK